MSLFSSPTTWSNNNSIWNKTSLKSLEKRKKKKYIIEFLLEKTGLKVKTSNFFFYQSAFTQNAAFFVSIICAWIIEVEKNKTQEKSV